MLRDGKKDSFDAVMKIGLASDRRARSMLRFRMRPFGTASYYEFFRAVSAYRLADVVDRIACPMLVTDPENEQWLPGQAPSLYTALHCPKQTVRFTRDQGADMHCEVAAPGYRDYCIYNWLAEVLA